MSADKTVQLAINTIRSLAIDAIQKAQLFARYRTQYPDLAHQIERLSKRELPPDWEKALTTYPPSPAGMATRDASGRDPPGGRQ